MRSILKTILACLLGLGYLVLDAHSKPSLAFLGFTSDSDPRVKDRFASQILFEMKSDTGLFLFSQDEISMLYTKGFIRSADIGNLDLPLLSKTLGAQFYAYGRLETNAITSENKRIWWKPWGVTTKWNEGIRLRLLDATQGKIILDSVVTIVMTEKSFVTAPDAFNDLSVYDKEKYIREMMTLVSKDAAKILSKAIKEKTQPVPVASTSTSTSTSESANGPASANAASPAP